MRFEQQPHDLPDNWLFMRWSHVGYLWRHREFRRMRRHIRRDIGSGNWRTWPIVDMAREQMRRYSIVALCGASIALGYNQGLGQARIEATPISHRRDKSLPAATIEPIALDPLCELEPMQSPPVIWLADWRNEVRALSGVRDQTRTHGARAYDPPPPSRHRRW